MTTDLEIDLKGKLKEVFGFNQFRGNQEKVIKNILNGRNTFVIMPTGAGKSLCYQLPALVVPGTVIVISPLIALMKNQVDQLSAFGINAQFLNSTLSRAEITRVRKQMLEGEIKLLYVAPESLTKEANITLLKKSNVSFVAIDEAHCISEWGHDFRPEYRRIRSIIEQLGDLPVIALTATATPKVQGDITKNLRMEDADIFLSSFYRENLYYEVRPKLNSRKQLVRFIHTHKGKSGIIYCLSRKKVESIAEFLCMNGVKALPYHAGLEPQQRMRNQDAFLNEDADVVVATIAFGMGIDKPDVRFVVHYDAPKSLEGYYQETGRAGRDGLEGHCLMFYSPKDISKLEKFIKDKSVTERENAQLLLQEMSYYATSAVCRPKQLLNYFGEYMEKDCGFCDNCRRKREQFPGKEYVQIAVEAVKQTGQRFSIEHLAKVVVGHQDEYTQSYGHDKLAVFGQGKSISESEAFWQSVVRQSIMMQLLAKDIDNVLMIKLSEQGEAFLKKPHTVSLYKDHDYEHTQIDEEDEISEAPRGSAADPLLRDQLRELRKKLAKQHKLPPYVIFQDPSIEEMATVYPTGEQEMANIIGVGMGKVKKFGKPFLELIDKYLVDNNITTAADIAVKSSANKSKTKISIIQRIDRQVDLEEIAEDLNMEYFGLLDELENISNSGTKLNLDYYIDHVIDQDRQDEIYDFFMEDETGDMELAKEEFGDDEDSEIEIRLVHIKFMSENAH